MFYKSFKESRHLFCKEGGESFKTIKTSYKSEEFISRGETSFIVSSPRGVCAYAYIRSIADLYFLLARANCGAGGSIGQDSSDCSVLVLRCRASNTHFQVSPLEIIIRGFK